MRESLVLVSVLLLFLWGCGASSTRSGPTAAQQAKACSAADAQQALRVLLKDQNDFATQLAQGNVAQMRTLVVQLSGAKVPVCAMTASRALGQYMADQLQRLTGTPSAALSNDSAVNATTLQNELTLMATIGRGKP